MALPQYVRQALAGSLLLALAACGGKQPAPEAAGTPEAEAAASEEAKAPVKAITREQREGQGGKVWDLFGKGGDGNVTTKVNKYIWNASLDVLNFLPIQSVDPFTGVIVTGYGTPPGGGKSYRATIYIQDPALDARSLKLSLQGSGGAAVAPETVHAVEDAILNRARQLRIADSGL